MKRYRKTEFNANVVNSESNLSLMEISPSNSFQRTHVVNCQTSTSRQTHNDVRQSSTTCQSSLSSTCQSSDLSDEDNLKHAGEERKRKREKCKVVNEVAYWLSVGMLQSQTLISWFGHLATYSFSSHPPPRMCYTLFYTLFTYFHSVFLFAHYYILILLHYLNIHYY